MTCRAPLEAARKVATKDRPIVYRRGMRPKTLAEGYEALELPCGQCASCRLEYSRRWAARLIHEAAYWEEFWAMPSYFITLTYEDNHLPLHGMLKKEDVQNFLKRLRFNIGQFRYYVVGEYGSTNPDTGIEDGGLYRPHYHLILFGRPLERRESLGHRDGVLVWDSDQIEKAWTQRDHEGNKSVIGSHEIGTCTFESCAYVARYVMKKQVGDVHHVENHYTKHVWETDTLVQLPPEFAMMSRGGKTRKGERGGIGARWLEKYELDILQGDELPIPGRGIIGKPPPYYDSILEEKYETHYETVKAERREAMAKSLVDGPSLQSRAKVQDAKISMLYRS